MGRNVPAASLIRGQIDLYSAGVTRAVGVVPGDLTLKVFHNNSPRAWTLLDGSAVPDSSISSGSVYFHEVSGTAGYYAIRFFPDLVGFWRIVLTHPILVAEVVLEFDVSAPAASPSGGLNASFTG